MRLLSPMTLIVVIALTFCLVTGVAIILRYTRRGDGLSSETCPQCGAAIRANARYCGRCGADMSGRSQVDD